MVLTIEIPNDQAERLRLEAERLGTTPEELAKLALTERLDLQNQRFDEAADYVLAKNADLYKRLS